MDGCVIFIACCRSTISIGSASPVSKAISNYLTGSKTDRISLISKVRAGDFRVFPRIVSGLKRIRHQHSDVIDDAEMFSSIKAMLVLV